MESPADRQRLQNPELALGPLSGLVIIDEIQLVPELFGILQVVAALNTQEVYFWATQGGAELDLLFFSGGRRFGVEFTFNEAPKVTKSMLSALTDLSLAHLWVVYPGVARYAAHEKITMLPLAEVAGLPAEIVK